jgi:hypothetical protein
MGLDMYLYKRNSIFAGDWVKPEFRQEVIVKKAGEIDPRIKSDRIREVIEEVGYWRKANHIHKWFVENVQNGVDDCKEYYVSASKLSQLRDLCAKVLEDDKLASELLPTTSGYFFGGTEYDEYYFGELQGTIRILDEAIANSDGDYYYRASW